MRFMLRGPDLSGLWFMVLRLAFATSPPEQSVTTLTGSVGLSDKTERPEKSDL